MAMEQLKEAGCETIYIDGSFITNKLKPGDFLDTLRRTPITKEELLSKSRLTAGTAVLVIKNSGVRSQESE